MPVKEVEKWGRGGAIQRRQFSDDESAPSKKKKQRAPVAVKPRAVRLPSSLRDAVTALATQEFSSLPTSSQVLLLHALYEEAVSTETILEEAKKRKEALTQLQQELFSVGTQMREITALYSKQELALRDPTILVCGYTASTLDTLFDRPVRHDRNENLFYHVPLNGHDVLVLDYWHPANQFPDIMNYYGLMGIYQQALRST